MKKSDAIQDWRRRLADARRSGYTVLAERLIHQFVETLLSVELDEPAARRGMLELRDIAEGRFYGGSHIKTLARWAKGGKWEGARKTSGEQGHWLIPAESVYADLMNAVATSDEGREDDGKEAAQDAAKDPHPIREPELLRVPRRLRRRRGLPVGDPRH